MTLRNNIDASVIRRRATLNPTKYIVSVSGGKDSQLVLSLAIEWYGRENVEAVHHYTGIDHSLTYEHMKWMEDFYRVPIQYTSNKRYKDMWELIDKSNAIPSMFGRFCTKELKIHAMNAWLRKRGELSDLVCLLGMRGAESQNRAKNYSDLNPEDEFSYQDLAPDKVPMDLAPVRVRLPIVNMSTGDVFAMLKARGEKVNPLYSRGFTRVGCFPCILAGKGTYRMAARDPEGRATIIKLRDMREMLSITKDLDPTIIIPHDLDAILAESLDSDPFGFNEPDDDTAGGCQWCQE